MAEETKETKERKFGEWIREYSGGIAIASIFGISGLFVGYTINNNAQQSRAYQRDIVSILGKVIQQDPNQAKLLVDSIKPKQEVKEEKKEIEKEADRVAKDKEKYISILEEHRGLRKENDELTVERNALMQKYDALSKEQAPLQQKYTKTLEELTATLKTKEQLEARQKELVKQVADVNEAAVKLTDENNKLNKSYVVEAEAKNKLEVSLTEVTAKLTELDKKYLGLQEEKAELEGGITETTKDLNKTLRDYNALLRQKEFYKPRTGTQRTTGEGSRLEEELETGLPSHQIQTIRNTKGLSIVFLKGDLSGIDKKESDFYEETYQYSTKDIVNRSVGEPGRYALLVDVNGDGIEDVLYKRGTGIGLKEGRIDGTFASGKPVSSEFSQGIQKEYILKGLGFD